MKRIKLTEENDADVQGVFEPLRKLSLKRTRSISTATDMSTESNNFPQGNDNTKKSKDLISTCTCGCTCYSKCKYRDFC